MGCWLYRLRARIEQKSNHFFTDVAEQVRGVVSVHLSILLRHEGERKSAKYARTKNLTGLQVRNGASIDAT
jgi:hypothetical protein